MFDSGDQLDLSLPSLQQAHPQPQPQNETKKIRRKKEEKIKRSASL